MVNPDATVFVVDDDEAIGDSLRVLIDSIGMNVEVYGSAEEFLDAYDPSKPGCLLLDVRLPGMSGLELQKKLAASRISIPVIIITSYGDVPMSVQAIKAGAVQFLQKPFRDQELLDHILEAIDADTVARRERAERAAVQGRMALLTPREREVLTLVVADKINKQIAALLGISVRTVEAHRAHIMEKLQVNTAAGLTRMSIRAETCGENRHPSA